MSVRRAFLSSSRLELGSNTITAALHISYGLDDYQPNVIIDLHVRKIGNVHDVKENTACACVYGRLLLCVRGCVCVSVQVFLEAY